MRRLLILILLTYSSVAKAHDYYFAFVEMEYNEVDNRIEVTLTATTHDVEKALMKNGYNRPIIWSSLDSVFHTFLSNEINRQLSVSFNEKEKPTGFILEGVENELTGITRFYLSCPLTISAFSSLTIRFDFLMDTFPDQQNKLTFIYREQKQTVSFLSSKKTVTLSLY